MPGARSQSLHCSNGSMRHVLRKTVNDNINETIWVICMCRGY